MTANSSIPVSGNNAIDALLGSRQWGTNGQSFTITYSIPQPPTAYWINSYSTSNEPGSWSALNSTQSSYFRTALALWAEVANIAFTEVADSQTYGEIRIAFSQVLANDPNAAGWAYLPGSSASAGDIWLDPAGVDNGVTPGTSGFSLMLHESGHALGLDHPFEPNATNGAVLTGTENSEAYTLMSYTSYYGAGYRFTSTGQGYTYIPVQPETPMLYDILAMQYLYGANQSTRSGNDTYTFSNTEGQLKTIWDGGGTDTLDLSNQSYGQTIDLTAGHFSSLGVKKEWNNTLGPTITGAAQSNIAIAYGVTIENAIGGSGADTILGNDASNSLTGNGGNDYLDGGAGTDQVNYNGIYREYQISTNTDGSLTVSHLLSNEVDTLKNIEWLQFSDQRVAASSLLTTEQQPTTPSEVVIAPREAGQNHINYFLLQIGAAQSVDASVSYTTRNGTAVAGQDYVAKTGTATITAGQTSTVIGIEIIGDSIAESDETFMLVISNPVGGIFPAGQTEITATHTIIDDDAALARPPIDFVGVSLMDFGM